MYGGLGSVCAHSAFVAVVQSECVEVSITYVHILPLSLLYPIQTYSALTNCVKVRDRLLPCRRRLHHSQTWWARRMPRLPPA